MNFVDELLSAWSLFEVGTTFKVFRNANVVAAPLTHIRGITQESLTF